MSLLLQGGLLPGILTLLVGIVALLVTFGVTFWVYRDASRRRNDRALLWGLGTLVGFLVGFFPGLVVVAVYLFVRD